MRREENRARRIAERPRIQDEEEPEQEPKRARVEEGGADGEGTEVNGVGSVDDGPDSEDDEVDMDLDSESDEGSVPSEVATLGTTKREEERGVK